MKNILARCKCGVYLTVNEHRDIYLPVKDAIEAINDLEQGSGGDPLDDELVKRMVKTGDIYILHFYPDTPIGSYRVYGTSLDEVVAKGKECLGIK